MLDVEDTMVSKTGAVSAHIGAYGVKILIRSHNCAATSCSRGAMEVYNGVLLSLATFQILTRYKDLC